MKDVVSIQLAPPKHWVGDGFHVSSLFSYNSHGKSLSPFLLLDHASPEQFPATTRKLGVGEHPHRGIETITLVYAGEVEHQDSTGAGGVIKAGDVQWMTAGRGIMHQEFHSSRFAKTGGQMEMVQLWVNLSAKDKMAEPKYQDIKASSIPTLSLGNDSAELRLIAGQYLDNTGPASTFTPLQVMDLIYTDEASVRVDLNATWNAAVVVLQGKVEINSNKTVSEHQMAILSNDGDYIDLKANKNTKLLILSGEPINEPIVGYGPFVMNSREEIEQALRDFRDGAFGQIQ
ncbi:pirin family protein [Kangiella sp. HZ709]|uniref:pirin family protein n=1 Tax=Kangiella sp. HZ709 TaxID=2666328 RepID=UPI0012AF322E|nr:pirin family protein [Kangiella sp. HZ709]MRX26732.1 pirin family protein [Kangiella sp. HZ709]